MDSSAGNSMEAIQNIKWMSEARRDVEVVFEYSTGAIVAQQTRHARNGGAQSLHTMWNEDFHCINISGLCGAKPFATIHDPGVTDNDRRLCNLLASIPVIDQRHVLRYCEIYLKLRDSATAAGLNVGFARVRRMSSQRIIC